MKQPRIKLNDAIEAVMSAGLSVVEHTNNSDVKTGNNHITIVGGKRHVDFWNTTTTFYANAVKGKSKAIRGTGIKNAIRVAKEGN